MKRIANHFAPILAVAAVALVPAAFPQNMANRMTPADTMFAQKAAAGGLAEVQLGTLAQQKAENPDVKAFGRRMVEDHTRLNQELQGIAGRSGVTLPGGPSTKDQEEYNRLSQLNGAAFDHAYIRDMIADHRGDITEIRHESDEGTNPEMKAFATKSLPTLEEHLRLAQTAARSIRGER
jgi:putative membrane protein